MSSTISVICGCLVASYIFLRFLLNFTHDAKEPPTIMSGIPFVSPLVGMIREKASLYIRLRFAIRLLLYLVLFQVCALA